MPFDSNHAGPIAFSAAAPAIAGTRQGALLILGGARCVWSDLDRLAGGVGKWPGEIMAVNDIGMYFERPIQHWATLHPEKLAAWSEIRRRSKVDNLRDPETHALKTGAARHVWPIAPHGGNSTIFGAIIGLLMGYERIVLAGAPLDDAGHFFDAPGPRPLFSRADLAELESLSDTFFAGRVTSLSGKTREILGAPQ